MRIKRALKAISLLLFSTTIFFIVFGLLFPWLPLKPGYSAIKSKQAIVYAQDTAALDPAYANIDTYMAEAEKFIGLKFKRKVRVIVLSHKWECLIHTGRTKGKAVTMPTGDAIYVRPQKRPFPTEDFLKHELSHCLLFQNMNVFSAWKTSEERWVVEGTGIAFGGPRYMSDAEFGKKLVEPGGAAESASRGVFANRLNDFTYTLYGEFIRSLIKSYGSEKWRLFLKRYVDNPESPRDAFKNAFGTSQGEALKKFISERTRYGNAVEGSRAGEGH